MTPHSLIFTGFFLAATLLTAPDVHAETPPLNCHRAKTGVMRTICASPELKAMDREIAALNDRGMAALDPDDQRRLALTQLAYFRHRNGCEWAAHHSAHPGTAIDECIRSDMEARLAFLQSAVYRGHLSNR